MSEPVQTSGQQRVDGWRDRQLCDVAHQDPLTVVTAQELVVDQHRQHLFDEQRYYRNQPD